MLQPLSIAACGLLVKQVLRKAPLLHALVLLERALAVTLFHGRRFNQVLVPVLVGLQSLGGVVLVRGLGVKLT